MDYLPSSIYLSVVDAKLRTEMGAERMLAEVLEPLKSRYDYILIDTCPALGMLTINALAAADMALAGIISHIPLDQVIDAMGEVGMKMDVTLRETSMGGVATSPKGLEIAERLGM